MSRRTSTPILPPRRDACGKPYHQALDTYEAVVAAYIRDKRASAASEFGSYAALQTLQAAIQYAALSQDPVTHKRHPHQTRIPQEVLVQARDRLLKVNLQACRSFEELIEVILGAIGSVCGIGGLAVYDIATRIGAYLRLEPDRVYLHAGTRAGVSSLLPVKGRMWILPDELPRAFAKLRPREIEDCLCIFKDALHVIAGQGDDNHRMSGRHNDGRA